ncbi:hypothetical protein N0V85_007938 [Neurospora sp. IMI 360204]|nr:hypothetical protein N0V85_007938 [Neurospora sp. IMI 360204]
MAPKLCDVCSRVPAWLGSKPWDDVYYRHDPPITLRSFVDMRAEAEKGPGSCHLCQLIFWAADRNEGWRPIEGQRSDFAWVSTPFVMRRHWDIYKKKYEFYYVGAFNFKSGSKPPHLGDNIRLVSSELAGDIPCEGLLPPTYVTLSHCWGPPEKRPMMTTKMTLAKRMERIPFVDLPRTFQDAVDVTRQLGQRYLWIDSLCIVQDDEEDWAREAGLMAKVYSQAYCTLAALSAHDSSEGLQLVEDVQGSRGPFVDLMVPIPTANGCGDTGSSFQVDSQEEHWEEWQELKRTQSELAATLARSREKYNRWSSEYVAPSWSWASVGAPVEEINVLHKYDDPYGPLKGANLVLSGARLVDVELIAEPFDEPDRVYRDLKRDGVKVASYHTDVAGEAEQSTAG